MSRKRYTRTLKTLYPSFENVVSELRKRYIRTLKTLYPNFENVTSELWKRDMQTLKRYIRTLKMFEQMNKKVDQSE